MRYKLITNVLLWSLLAVSSICQAEDVTLFVENSRVGVGTDTPQSKLHVTGTEKTKVLVQNADAGAAGDQVMFQLKNASASKVRFSITSNGNNTWTFDNIAAIDTFSISKVGTGKSEFQVRSNGDGIFGGRSFATEHVNTSSREAKTDFADVDVQGILASVASLPLSQWRYKQEGNSSKHVGPMSEDFQQAFGLGDGKTISTVDASGIAFAAIQGLKLEKDAEIAQIASEVAEKDNEIAALKEKLSRQDERMLHLEMALAEVLRKQFSEAKVSLANN
jgi:endosialidase-like protein